MENTPAELAAGEPLDVRRDGYEPEPAADTVRCITACVVYMELDGRVVATPDLAHLFLVLRPADDADMSMMLGRAKTEADARIAYSVFEELAGEAVAAAGRVEPSLRHFPEPQPRRESPTEPSI